MTYTLGLDIGTNSLGWAILDGNAFTATGARIFGDGRDPKSGASLAEDRRLARQMRRRRDRYLRRRSVLLSEMIEAGLMPVEEGARKALERLDPYDLRVRALDERLEPGEIGRALFHLNQRRGFRSNRKTAKKDAEDGKIRTGVRSLHTAMEERDARTYGEFLRMRRDDGQTVRARLRPDETEYDFYPDRTLLEQEFDAIWAAQVKYRPDLLTVALHARLFEVVFFQRPLKAPKIGRCLFYAEDRLPKRHPLFQRRRLFETVNQLRIARTGGAERTLTLEERNVLINKLKYKKSITFKSLAKTLRLDTDERFTLESERRKDLTGDEVAASLGDKKRFGQRWQAFDRDRQWEIVERLHETEDDEEILAWLTGEFGVEREVAQAIADAPLPEGYGRIGLTATREILAELEKDVVTYDKAVAVIPSLRHHSDFRTGEIADRLPYYGEVLERHVMPGTSDPADDPITRYGRLTNPTVHIGLGQVRRVVNALIDSYGPPGEIVVEIARDLKMNDRQRQENDKRLTQTTRAAIARGEKLEGAGIPNTGANRLRMRLWEELNLDNVQDRRCVYTGQQIGPTMLFDEGKVEIDHILPYSRTLDDSPANRMLILREANRRKGNRSPFEAKDDFLDDWEVIAERATRLPQNKRWRFAADAMEKFEEQGGFEARQLVDTQHLAVVAKAYLEVVAPDRVRVIPGRLTEMLRRHWGLNSILPDHNIDAAQPSKQKNRLDHRHHAIDAAVIAATDRGLLQRMSTAAARNEASALDDIVGKVEPPWPDFRDDLRESVNAITVSHRPDHGTPDKRGAASGRDTTTARLHNDTAYGLTRETDEKGSPLVVRRVALGSLTPKQAENVRDPLLREALLEATAGLSGKDRELALKKFARSGADRRDKDGNRLYKGIRRVRVTEPLSVIPIRNREGRAYKGVKGDSNHCYEVWRMPDGKWKANVVTTFAANQPGAEGDTRPHPAAKKIMRLHRDDLVAYQKNGERAIARVVKFGQNGQVTLAAHNEAGDLKKRDALKEGDPFKYFSPTVGGLKKAQARKIRVDASGRIFDPGPQKP